MNSDNRIDRPLWSLADFKLGARLSLPILPAMITFGLAVGAAAAAKGLRFCIAC